MIKPALTWDVRIPFTTLVVASFRTRREARRFVKRYPNNDAGCNHRVVRAELKWAP